MDVAGGRVVQPVEGEMAAVAEAAAGQHHREIARVVAAELPRWLPKRTVPSCRRRRGRGRSKTLEGLPSEIIRTPPRVQDKAGLPATVAQGERGALREVHASEQLAGAPRRPLGLQRPCDLDGLQGKTDPLHEFVPAYIDETAELQATGRSVMWSSSETLLEFHDGWLARRQVVVADQMIRRLVRRPGIHPHRDRTRVPIGGDAHAIAARVRSTELPQLPAPITGRSR